mmetsp:Transcript_14130/g.35704  ORF Transcript_14130/g.35704 Transcript_14130/m.35704 type:complete len:375 (-) Transcript_14130:155-1279(-)
MVLMIQKTTQRDCRTKRFLFLLPMQSGCCFAALAVGRHSNNAAVAAAAVVAVAGCVMKVDCMMAWSWVEVVAASASAAAVVALEQIVAELLHQDQLRHKRPHSVGSAAVALAELLHFGHRMSKFVAGLAGNTGGLVADGPRRYHVAAAAVCSTDQRRHLVGRCNRQWHRRFEPAGPAAADKPVGSGAAAAATVAGKTRAAQLAQAGYCRIERRDPPAALAFVSRLRLHLNPGVLLLLLRVRVSRMQPTQSCPRWLGEPGQTDPWVRSRASPRPWFRSRLFQMRSRFPSCLLMLHSHLHSQQMSWGQNLRTTPMLLARLRGKALQGCLRLSLSSRTPLGDQAAAQSFRFGWWCARSRRHPFQQIGLEQTLCRCTS